MRILIAVVSFCFSSWVGGAEFKSVPFKFKTKGIDIYIWAPTGSTKEDLILEIAVVNRSNRYFDIYDMNGFLHCSIDPDSSVNPQLKKKPLHAKYQVGYGSRCYRFFPGYGHTWKVPIFDRLNLRNGRNQFQITINAIEERGNRQSLPLVLKKIQIDL